MPAVLLAHPGYRSDGPHRAILEENGFELRLPPDGADLSREQEFAAALAGCEATIAGTEPYTALLLEHAPQLRAIARSGVGYDAIDLAAADARGIAVTTTPGTNEHSVAEHALAMLLAIARGFPERDRQVRRGGPWHRRAGPRLAGKTLGILGLGRIGRALATRARGLELHVLAYEPYPDNAFVAQWEIELVPLDELVQRSDFVSIHAPLSDQTRGLFDRETISQMKPGAMLVNTSRGGIVNEEDLAAALRGGRLAAAALDVFEFEPLPTDSPLLELDNLLLSPHLAGLDEQSAHDAAVMVARTLVDLHEGRWPAGCVVNLNGVEDWKW
jgi:D-3-phosphoglycerate dehydrogenase